MKQIFIGAAVNYAASKLSATVNTALTPDTLAVGAMGVYGIKPDGYTYLITSTASGTGLVTAASFTGGGLTFTNGTGTSPNITGTVVAGAATGMNRFFIAVGTNTGCFITDQCSYKDVVQISNAEYTAPVKQVMTITPTMPASTTKYDEYTLNFVKRNNIDNAQVTYTVQGIYASATALVTAFKTKINLDNKFVATGSTTLILTNNNFGDYFLGAIAGTSLLITDLVYTTQPTYGIGYGPNVYKEEKKLSTERGNLNTADWVFANGSLKSPVFYAGVGATYDMFYLHFKVQLSDKTLFDQSLREDRFLEVAFPTGNYSAGANEYDFKAIMDTLFNTNFNIIPETGNLVLTS